MLNERVTKTFKDIIGELTSGIMRNIQTGNNFVIDGMFYQGCNESIIYALLHKILTE